jgi:HEAT repeat protein
MRAPAPSIALFVLLVSTSAAWAECTTPTSPSDTLRQVPAPQLSTGALVEALRDLPPQLPGLAPSSGRPSADEQRRAEIYAELRKRGPESVPALATRLRAPDLPLRQNASLALLVLAMDRSPGPGPRVDVSPAVPALIESLDDYDIKTRGTAAQTLGAVGPAAAGAVPALIRMLASEDEGSRNSACIALAGIGPAAREALPALRRAESDSRPNVRRFAGRAIERIGARP